jgi:hypothetical protein
MLYPSWGQSFYHLLWFAPYLNRGSIICEPSEDGIREFLRQHGLLPTPAQ